MKDPEQIVDNGLDEVKPSEGLNRRNFLKNLGSGVFILFSSAGFHGFMAQQRRRGRQYPTDFNAYLRIGEDGKVSCFTGKIEMGQGIITSLAQMLAEELEVSLESVVMVMGDTRLCPYDSGTTGSRSTKYFGPPLRRAAVEARIILLQLAAEYWSTSSSRLAVNQGIIFDKKNPHRRISYADLVKGKKITRHLKQEDIRIKPHASHKISGRATMRTDSGIKVTGEAKFAGDIRLPGMLYARVIRPPAHGATLKNVDVRAARKVKGIIVVQEKELVAVLHEHPEEADRALRKIKAQWYEEQTRHINNKTIFSHLEKSDTSSRVVSKKGQLNTGKLLSCKLFESVYYNHYVAHAPIEPYTILAKVEKDEVTAWASTQAPFRVQRTISETLNMPAEKIRVITPFVGGGFGGKKSGQQVKEAVLLSKLTGKPVQLAWSRKEEFFYDAFRPAAVLKAKSGLNKSGKIVYWDFNILFAGSRSSKPVYDIEHFRITSSGNRRGQGRAHLFNTGAWRGPGSNSNVFAMESHIDIMAQATGMDPLSFRLQNLKDKRMIRVLKAVSEKFGNDFSKGPSGKGYGVVCTDYLNTYVATIAEVKVDKKSGEVTVKRIVCAQDMGEIINPQGTRLQIEGGITMGLGSALSEEVQFKGGTILTDNFDSYEITRFSWSPKFDIVLIDNPEIPPQGCGEPAITTTAAVLANAIYDAIGVRMFTLPMTPERISRAITSG